MSGREEPQKLECEAEAEEARRRLEAVRREHEQREWRQATEQARDTVAPAFAPLRQATGQAR